jgi:hypothetical protein
MDQAAIELLERQISEEVRTRFPGDPAPRVAVLQYGDEPMIEPGELLVRLTLEATGGPEDQKQALHAFEQAHDGAIQGFWKDLRAQLPEAWRLEVRTSGDTGHGPRIMLGARRQDGSLEARAAEGSPDLTPVMTRMGQVDLETLDALITSGIASSRAEAVRWALARIRERPAYAQLRERAREIERLKTEF